MDDDDKSFSCPSINVSMDVSFREKNKIILSGMSLPARCNMFLFGRRENDKRILSGKSLP